MAPGRGPHDAADAIRSDGERGLALKAHPMKFTPNLVAGIAITILGSVLLLDRLGLMEIQQVLHLWPVLLTLFGLSIVVQAWKGETATGGVGAGRPIIGPGFVLFLVVVSILATRVDGRRFTPGGTPTDSEISMVAIMGHDDRVSLAPSFRSADMTSVMGRTRLDLRKATLAPTGEVTIDVLGMMGAVEVMVPGNWVVDVQARAIMGGVEDKRRTPITGRDEETQQTMERDQTPAARDRASAGPSQDPVAAPTAGETAQRSGAPRLVIRGTVVMGALVIRL